MSKGYSQCTPFEITGTTFFTEDFTAYQGVSAADAQGVMPTCWGKIYTGTSVGYDPKVYNGTSAVTSGNNCLAISAGSSFSLTSGMISAGNSNYAILPVIDNDLNGLEMVFASKMSSDSAGVLEVGYFTDDAVDVDSIDVNTFVSLATITSTTAAASQHIMFGDLITTPNFRANIVFRWSAAAGSISSYLSLASCYIDNISIRIARACADPTDVTVSNITDISAQISWTAGSADQSQWEISCNGNIIQNVTTNPYTLTGLTSSTSYEVNVRAVCTGESSYWAAQPVTFTTSCLNITITDNTPFVEDFTSTQAVDSLGSTGVVPDCWGKIYTGSTAGYDPKVYNGEGSVTHNNNCLALTAGVVSYSLFGYTIPLYNTGSANYVILPNISLNLDTLQMVFTSKMSTDTAGVLEIGYFTDMNDASSFVALTTIPSTTVATGQSVTFGDLPGVQNLNANIVLRWSDNSTSASSNCYIDNIMIRIARDCAEPTDIVVSNISDVAAVVSWTADPSQNQWEISCNGNIISNVTTNPYTLTGLTAETEYEINVRAVCTNENSYWAAQPVTFRTACPAIVVDDEHPFTEGFEGADMGCWAADIVTGEDNWGISYYANHSGSKGVAYSSSVFGDLSNMGGDISAIMDLFNNMTNFGNGSARLTSPILDLTGVTGPVRLSFFRKQTTMMIPQTLYVYYRVSPSAQWSLLQMYNSSNDWIGEAINLPNPSATYQISFLSFCDIQGMGNIDPTSMMDPNAASDFSSTLFLDDIRVGYTIVCNNPTNLTFNNVSTTSATATWGGTAENWTLEYGPSGFTAGTGTTVTAQNPTYTFTGLTPGTSYDVHVRANCAENNFSEWVQSYFTTESEIGINENGSCTLTLSPNPTNGTVRCTLSSLSANTRLQVLDVYGKLLMEKEVTGQTTELDFTDKASGLYFLRVVSDNKVVTTQKVIRR